VTDFADDPGGELRRKASALMWVALAESVTYVLLLYFWLVARSAGGTAVLGSVHGMVWLACCAMVIMITPEMRWGWWYAALVIVTGPVGALLVFARIRRHGVPDQVRTRSVAGAPR
jgi:hypothetical protein